MKKKPRVILDIYVKFRQQIKGLMNSQSPCEEKFVLIDKENISNWKNLYEYSKELISNNYDIIEWESKMNYKFQNNPPNITFTFFKDYNEIKNHLSKKKGIALIKSEFIKYFCPSNNRYKEINCHFGKRKILMEFFDNILNHCLICKLGSKFSAKYMP